MAQGVDTDLFVNAFSRGIADGAKTPSAFTSFTGGLISGMDDAAKYDAQMLKNEEERNKINQLPTENRIRESQAKIYEANADQVTSPEYADLQKKKLENDIAAQQQESSLRAKKQELFSVMDGDDGKAKGQAYLSGHFDDLFAADPKLKEQVVERTYKDWGDEDQKTYQIMKRKGRERDWYASVEEATLKKNYENEQAFLGSDEIADLREKAGKISPTELIEKGEIREIVVPPKVPVRKIELDSAGKPKLDSKNVPIRGTEVVRDQYGSVVMEDDPYADQKDYKTKKAFFYDGKLVSDSISDDTAKNYRNYKQTYSHINKLGAGQNGDTDRDKEAQASKAKKEAEAAAAKVAQSEEASRVKEQQDNFWAGAKISKQYQGPAKEVKRQMEENASTAPKPTSNVSVPTMRGLSSDRFFDKAISMSQEPAEDKTILNAQTGQREPRPNWVKKDDIKLEMATAKAQMLIDRYSKKQQTPPTDRPDPITQAKQVTQSSFIPEKIEVKTSYQPNYEAVKYVAERPEVQGFSALTKAVMVQESGGRNGATSPTGVQGLMQVTENTARRISPDLDRNDPVQSVMGGAIELERLLATPAYEGNPMIALTAYNAGEGVMAEAIRLAGTTDWNTLKNYIEPAVTSPKMLDYWKSLEQKYNVKIDPVRKAKEAREYAEKVITNLPAFVSSRKDMTIVNNLKRQGVVNF